MPATLDELQAEADERLIRFVELALGSTDSVQCMAVRGSTAKVLVNAAATAQLLVLEGPPLSNAATRSSLIALQITRRVPCPIVVVPAQETGSGRVSRALVQTGLTSPR